MKPFRLSLLVTLGVVATIRAASPLTLTTVLGHSMEPTLRPGGPYVLDRGYYRSHAQHRGDIVELRKAGQTYIKRVYALPGDRLSLLKADDGSGDQILQPREAAHFQRAHPGRRLPCYHGLSLAV